MKTSYLRTCGWGLFCLGLLPGCGTIAAHTDTPPLLPANVRVYRGVAWEGAVYKTNPGSDPIKFLVLCDLPFSLLADTVMLPFDLRTPRAPAAPEQ